MKIGVGIDIHHYEKELINKVEIINIENPLYPKYLYNGYVKENLDFQGEIIVDGAYIDINPAVLEPDIQRIVKQRVRESINFAKHYKASEVIFLSTYIPDIRMDFYDEAWLDNSVIFWTEILQNVSGMRISICNTFERNPKILLELVKRINNKNFGMAFDIGHALIYSHITIDEWYYQVKNYIKTIYIHSNNKVGDQHLSVDEGFLLEDAGFVKIAHELKKHNLIIKLFDNKKLDRSIKSLELIRN